MSSILQRKTNRWHYLCAIVLLSIFYCVCNVENKMSDCMNRLAGINIPDIQLRIDRQEVFKATSF